jgi:hypothetical protein|tara:strand:+ start:403 stop:684 length:282 start_codon:yes stop_codon:yes gene_type:complete
MPKPYRIKLEDPPESNRGKSSTGALQDLIQRLGDQHPGQWSVLDRKKKNIGYLYALKKRHPNLQIQTRKNKDGTYGVWIKVGRKPRLRKAVKA